MKHILKMATVAAALAAPAWAEKPDDGLVHESASAMEGKTVAYVPIAMGFDLTEAWASGLRKDAEAWGYNLTIRDPNWSVDAGAQALSQLITEKPDVIVVHPPEIQAYARLLKQAARAGIPVITMNLKASENTDYFIGADWYDIAVQQTEQLIESGLVISGVSPDKNFVEIVEVQDHPWFLACQFHPEFKSRPLEPHPLFRSFVGAAREHRHLGQKAGEIVVR